MLGAGRMLGAQPGVGAQYATDAGFAASAGANAGAGRASRPELHWPSWWCTLWYGMMAVALATALAAGSLVGAVVIGAVAVALLAAVATFTWRRQGWGAALAVVVFALLPVVLEVAFNSAIARLLTFAYFVLFLAAHLWRYRIQRW